MNSPYKLHHVSCLFFLVCIACSPTTNSSQEKEEATPQDTVYAYPEAIPQKLKDCIAHYGGIQAWKAAGTLEYDLVKPDKREHHIVDLQNRKVRLSTEAYTLGFDGQEVWVSPDKTAFGNGSPRFYHNLYFYFFTIPFILTDPGINYQDVGVVTVDSTSYYKIEISYGENVGDSPEDVYKLYIDPETNALAFITYTVTYFSGESSDKFNGLKYSNWTSVGDLMFPQTLTSYPWNGETFGDKKGETHFENIQLKKERPAQSVFQMPANAEIDTLQVR